MGEAYDRGAFDARIERAIAEIVRAQADTGIDVIGDGEHSKVNWMAYARGRLSGLEEIDAPVRFRGATRDSTEFAAAYEDMKVMLAARSGAIVAKRTVRPKAQICSGPIRYVGQDEVRADLANLKTALNGVKAEEVFVTAISPSNLELYYENRHYATGRGVSGGAGRRHARGIPGDRRRRLPPADRRPAHGDALQPRARFLDRGLPQVHRAARRGGEPCAARHPGGARALPHLLQRQHRAARARFRAAPLRRPDAEDPRAGLSDRGAPIRATSTNGRSGRR